MEKSRLLTLAVILLVLTPGGAALAEETALEYPCYLLDAYDADSDGCWTGMDAEGRWPVPVDPEQLLVGPPPAFHISGVTLPTDHWVELKFRGRIIDGPGDDIVLVELDAVGEQALVFITDGCGQEYLLGFVAVPNISGYGPTITGFDIADISLPFVPCAVRVVGIDLRGGSPGFDLGYVRARTSASCGYTACNPNPIDGAKNVPVDAVLNWSPGHSAEKHIVHFGTAPSDVDPNATAVGDPAQPQDVNSFDPAGLEFGKTYYWRIDEVNSTDANSPRMGEPWRFTVADYLVVDDFESYDRYTLYDAWMQTGQEYVYLSKNPGPFYKCRQSMGYSYYYDDFFYSEATYPFSSAQDWAFSGVKALELFFRGKEDNDTNGRMYLVLGDSDVGTVVPYDGDANNISKETWQLWRIDLQDLDVNLSNIGYISIGFSNATSQPPGRGIGTVFFDDIRLFPSRCLEENRPDADFNGDCAVGFDDLEEMAYSWLNTRHNIYPVAAPNAPAAWYKFDGNAYDSTGSFNGQPRGSPTYVPGVHGQAISFDGYNDSVEITGAAFLFSKISTAITIAFWQHGADSPHLIDTICCSDYTYSVYDPVIAINLGCFAPAGKYNWDCGSPWSFNGRLSGNHRYKSQWSGRWNHWAFTKDAEAGKMQIFLNGVLYDSRMDATSPVSGITSFQIGSGWYGGYDGLLDDFLIYDYALSEAEVAYVATNGTGIFDVPLMSPADLNSDNQIDFKDFCLLADNWLEEQLWP
ncbi:MAG: LamG domain-containing protein [Planctomycetota bacterium]|jgi:hypothetical protein